MIHTIAPRGHHIQEFKIMACSCIVKPEKNKSMIKQISFAPMQSNCQNCGGPLDFLKSKCGFCSSPLNFESVEIKQSISDENSGYMEKSESEKIQKKFNAFIPFEQSDEQKEKIEKLFTNPTFIILPKP